MIAGIFSKPHPFEDGAFYFWWGCFVGYFLFWECCYLLVGPLMSVRKSIAVD